MTGWLVAGVGRGDLREKNRSMSEMVKDGRRRACALSFGRDAISRDAAGHKVLNEEGLRRGVLTTMGQGKCRSRPRQNTTARQKDH